jgi:hypothetical protein
MNRLLPKNEHIIERVLRVGAGLTLIALAAQGVLPAWGYVGVVPLLTGLIGSCPLYTVFGFSTCSHRPHNQTTTN